jgi:hypothetical protein
MGGAIHRLILRREERFDLVVGRVDRAGPPRFVGLFPPSDSAFLRTIWLPRGSEVFPVSLRVLDFADAQYIIGRNPAAVVLRPDNLSCLACAHAVLRISTNGHPLTSTSRHATRINKLAIVARP